MRGIPDRRQEAPPQRMHSSAHEVRWGLGCHTSPPTRKVSSDPVQDGGYEGDGWDQMARWLFLRAFLIQVQTKLEPLRTHTLFSVQPVCSLDKYANKGTKFLETGQPPR